LTLRCRKKPGRKMHCNLRAHIVYAGDSFCTLSHSAVERYNSSHSVCSEVRFKRRFSSIPPTTFVLHITLTCLLFLCHSNFASFPMLISYSECHISSAKERLGYKMTYVSDYVGWHYILWHLSRGCFVRQAVWNIFIVFSPRQLCKTFCMLCKDAVLDLR